MGRAGSGPPGERLSLEVELKLALVDPNRLGALLAALPTPVRVVEQHNHYFVHAGQAGAGVPAMVRVRESFEERDGAMVLKAITLTVKRRHQTVDGLFVAEEHEQPVAGALWEAIGRGEAPLEGVAGPALDWLRAQGPLGPLRRQGAMTNRRHVVPLGGYTLEVDRTAFPDGSVDVEVEVETDDAAGARAVVEAAAAEAGVALVDQTMTKYARFLARGGARQEV